MTTNTTYTRQNKRDTQGEPTIFLFSNITKQITIEAQGLFGMGRWFWIIISSNKIKDILMITAYITRQQEIEWIETSVWKQQTQIL